MSKHHRISPHKQPTRIARILILVLSVCISLVSCERDEICIDAITPHLIIRFYDQETPDDFKTPNLEVQILGLPDTLRFTADSIALPLRVNAPETVYILSTVEGTERNPDTLTVSYDINDLFIGRACGYKSVFVNPVYQRTPDSDTWISSFISTNELIENEQNAHLNIYH